MRLALIAILLAAAACSPVNVDDDAKIPPQVARHHAMTNFKIAVHSVTPVAEQLCRDSAPRKNCDFNVVVDDRPGLSADARQSLDVDGRPVLTFNAAMIVQARNVDEIAFIVAHEAAHHIADHLARLRQIAIRGADQSTTALGMAAVGAPVPEPSDEGIARARARLKDFELEADALGAQIAATAGFDPLNGAQVFLRISDPGDHALGSHPANGERLRTVRRTVRGF